MIHLGFGRAKTMDDKDTVGSIVFFPGQADQILNFDKTSATLDNTTGSRGGRPPIVFHAHGIYGAATMERKTGYSATMICGSTAAGDPLPPHFQLKSEATAKRQRLNIDHIAKQSRRAWTIWVWLTVENIHAPSG